MFWYTAALRWSRNFTFLITFGLGGLWQMLYAPSGFHSMQILKEFILISGFWEEMAHTNIYIGFLKFLLSPYPIWKGTTAPKVSTSHLSCSRSWISLGSFLHLPLSRNCITIHWRFLAYICILYQTHFSGIFVMLDSHDDSILSLRADTTKGTILSS